MPNQDPSIRVGGLTCCTPLVSEPLGEARAVELARVFKALGDPVRLRLLSLIASHEGGEACVCELTGVFDLSGPTISHHLKVLRESGLITGDRRGTWIYYRVSSDALRRLGDVLALDPPTAAVGVRSAPSPTGRTNPEHPEVLFVCVHNAGRSQMAAALLDRHAAGRIRVTSAGSAPAEEINPAVRDVMAELGIDLSRAFPKKLTTDAVQAADVVITMGCGDACLFFPGKRYLDWDMPDPAGRSADQVRRIRDEIDSRVRALLTELVAAPPS